MPSPNEYRVNPDIKAIRVHPEGGDLGRNWPLELGVVGDELAFLEALATPAAPQPRVVGRRGRGGAQDLRRRAGAQSPERREMERETGALHPSVIGKELHDFLYKGKIDPKQTLSGWGGFSWQRTTVPFLRANRPGRKSSARTSSARSVPTWRS